MVDSSYERSKKRKGKKPIKKLLIGEHVEILYTDEGLNGSWHVGTVIGCREHARVIEYTNLQCDDNRSKLIESIHVSSAIEGLHEKTLQNYRGNIRPLPSYYQIQESGIKYGLCVDALIDDAWWEGVVFDKANGSKQRLIFFPDQGDQQMVALDNLRLTQEWNEVTGNWKIRGEWLMLRVLQPFEREEELPVSVREIWFDLRSTDAFLKKIGVWTLGSQSTWHVLVSELIQELQSVVHGVIASKKLIDFSICPNDIEIPTEEFRCVDGIDLLKEGSNENTCLAVTLLQALDDHSLSDSRGKRRAGESWKSVDLEAACYPEAIQICASEDVDYPFKRAIRLKAKKQLLAMGWKIETKSTETNLRFRFVSPEGKFYYYLRKACSVLLHGHQKRDQKRENICKLVDAKFHHNSIDTQKEGWRENSSLDAGFFSSGNTKLIHKEESQPLSKMIDSSITKEISSSAFDLLSNDFGSMSHVCDDLELANLPKAVVEYKKYVDLSRAKGKHDISYDISVMKLNARKHLKLMGWNFEIKGQKRKVLAITSPTGKRFRSLYSACDEYLREECKELGVDALVTKRNRKLKRKKMISHFSSSSFANLDDSGPSVCKKSKRKKACQSLVRQGSRKRPRENLVQTTSQHVSKTVLSLLIDNDMILPRQKVRYVSKGDGKVLMEGQVTRDGIKCKCCKIVHSLSDFESHAGSTYQHPSARIFLQDGRSLLECEMQMIHCKKPTDIPRNRLKGDCSQYESDTVCSVCHDGGILLLCDHCPSSFHLSCVGLENVPKEKWFCPSCQCGLCGSNEFNSDTEHFTDKTMLYCDQCEREYHVGCMRKRKDSILSSCPVGNWLCSKKCSKIFLHLRQLLGKSNPTAIEGLSWTILRSNRENKVDNLQFDAETVTQHDIKLCVALDVLHECFVSIIEPRTQSDFVADLVFNRESELRRLNFYGFYTMLLEKGDELISVATFRVYGDKVAEMPLVGTRVKFRRQGMCRLLVNELEKVLSELGVERLVLPAVPQLLKTWTSSFGFSKMTSSERLDLSEYTTLTFQDTTMCSKLLTTAIQEKPKGLVGECKELMNTSNISIENEDSELYGNVSEVFGMVEPINALPPVEADHFQQIDYHNEAENSPVSVCISPNEQTERESGLHGLVNVAPINCRDSYVLANTSTISLKSPTNLDFKFLTKCYEHIGKDVIRRRLMRDINRVESTFKYFYKRRMSTNS